MADSSSASESKQARTRNRPPLRPQDLQPQDLRPQDLQSLFLASVTHEFRTPLTALNASVEYLLEEFDQLSKDEIRMLLKSVSLSATGLQTLIDNLLESLTIEAGHFVIRPEQITLKTAVEEAIHIVNPLLNRRRQRLQIIIADKLPQVYADATRLTQVLVNLLSNASKYGPMEQTITLELQAIPQASGSAASSGTADGSGSVLVSVTDQGPGIPPDKRASVFQRFTRLESPDGPQYGIGLGLSVVKVIVEEHGGEVGITQGPNGGSSFWFTLPVATAPDS